MYQKDLSFILFYNSISLLLFSWANNINYCIVPVHVYIILMILNQLITKSIYLLLTVI